MTRTDPAIHTNKRTTQWKKDDLTIELRMAELKATRAGRAQRSAPAPSVRYALADLVSLKASDVGMTDLAVGPSRSNADGFIDGGITRGEHTPITSCYYLLMDSLGIRERPNEAAPVEAEAKAASQTYPQKAGKENAAPDVLVIDHPEKKPVDAEADKPPALVV